jgi:hypothetical protein
MVGRREPLVRATWVTAAASILHAKGGIASGVVARKPAVSAPDQTTDRVAVLCRARRALAKAGRTQHADV